MSFFAFPDKLTQVDYPAFLSHHDVVYLAPAPDGIDGLPLGNGDLGAIVWTPTDRLQFAVNKIDLWDDGPDGLFGAWGSPEEEQSTLLRSACALSISHGLPSFDRLYLTDFEGRLRLAEAQVDFRSTTLFSRILAEAFVSKPAGCLVVRYRDETEEPVARRFELSRWGTRSLVHWYSHYLRGIPFPLSLTGTETGTDGQHLWINQPLRKLHFSVVARLDGPVVPRRLHRRAGVFESKPTTDFDGTLYLAVVNSEEAADPFKAAIERVDAAAAQGPDAVTQEHRRSWQRFWEVSFVDLPPQQDYVENLWYLNSYHVGSACTGRYPPNHIHALWAWNRDVFPWGHYYHWNEQLHVYSLHAIGHPELALPHLRWRRAMLDQTIKDARQVHNREGAYFADVSNRKGYQETGGITKHNLTPGPQIAAQFWQHYQYTQDDRFLKEDAYPVIREVARFYLDTVERGEDGRCTFVGTQPYEGVLLLRDTLTDLAHARQLFHIFLEASEQLGVDAELGGRCRDMLSNLASYLTLTVSTRYHVPTPPDDLRDWGGDARPVRFETVKPGDPTMPMWFLGYKVAESSPWHGQEIPNGTPVHEGMRDPLTHLWIFTSTNIAPVFPASQVGLDQAGTPEFEAAVNTVKALGYDTQAFSLYMVSRARLGMANELQESLENWPQRLQQFPQGFYHYFGVGHPQIADAGSRSLKELRVTDAPGETVHWPLAISNHMSLEGGPVLQLAVNEMLLQSYSGTIRVFPAVPDDWEGRFRLHAVGRFVVSAARVGGDTEYVVIESKNGKPCRIANPWPGRSGYLYRQDDSWSRIEKLEGDTWAFTTQAETVYLLLPQGREPGGLATARISAERNRQPKTLGTARLGMPKGF
jgi:alpha-L-fucosidase 2